MMNLVFIEGSCIHEEEIVEICERLINHKNSEKYTTNADNIIYIDYDNFQCSINENVIEELKIVLEKYIKNEQKYDVSDFFMLFVENNINFSYRNFDLDFMIWVKDEVKMENWPFVGVIGVSLFEYNSLRKTQEDRTKIYEGYKNIEKIRPLCLFKSKLINMGRGDVSLYCIEDFF